MTACPLRASRLAVGSSATRIRRLVQDRPRDRDPLLLAARQVGDLPAPARHPERVKQLARTSGGGHARPPADKSAGDQNVGENRQPRD